MDTQTTPEIDPFQVRPPRRRTSRGRNIAIRAGIFGLILAAGGAGAYALLSEREPGKLPAEKLATIKIGPVEDMPEIKDGVPALATKPIRVIGTAPGLGLQPAPKPPETAPSRSASLEPSIDSLLNPAPTIVPKPVVPASKPVPTAMKPAADAKPASVPVTTGEQTASIAQPPPLPPRAERASASVPAPAIAAGKPATPPSNAAQVLRAPGAAVPPTRQAAAPAAAPSAAPVPAQIAAAEDDEVRVFGVPLPGGRQIRRAAENFADAVTGLPEKF